MEESPVDLSEIVWVPEPRGTGAGIDPAHFEQLASRGRGSRARREPGPRSPVFNDALEAVLGPTRDLLAVVGRLVHDPPPSHKVRHQSEIRHFVWLSFDEVMESIVLCGPSVFRSGRVVLRCGPGRLSVDPARFETDGRLHLPASRPDLRVRLAIEPWWSSRSAITLRLLPSHRWRYPRRYFEAAHGVVEQLVAASGPDQRPETGKRHAEWRRCRDLV